MVRRMIRMTVWFGCITALFAASVRADDQPAPAKINLRPTFHRRADLETWLRMTMIPGRMRPQDVIAMFGTHYQHPRLGNRIDDPRADFSTYIFDLDAMGVHDHRRFDALFFHFDKGTGQRLLSAGIEEEEHQTGFHLETTTGE